MSGLFKRFSSRRSAGPEGTEPPLAAEPGTADAPATTPAEPEGRQPLFTDPAAPTRVRQPEDPHAGPATPAADPDAHPAPTTPAADPDAHAAPATPAERNPYAAPNEPNPYVAPLEPNPDVVPAAAQPGVYQPAAGPIDPVADLPAGLDPDELAATPATSARRGRLRRRAAFLRAARELLLRDLGGFVYELHRTAHDVEYETHRRLRETKLTRLSRVDAELHELEFRLDDVRRQVLVREPGVGGECPHCGELYGSAAHYCSNCGLPLTEGARRELARSQQPQPAPEPAIVPAAAPVVAGVDQPTQEIPPLDPGHPNADPDFQWPRREGAESVGSWAATPAEPATRVEPAASDDAAPPEASPGGSDPEPATRVETAASDDAASPVAGEADAEPTPVEREPEAAPVADKRQPEASADEREGDAAPTADEREPEAAPAAVAADEPRPAAPETTSTHDEPAPPAEDAAPDEAQAGQSRNGAAHDDSILRPVERRP